MEIDLNCDMGESFGQYILGNDEAIMPYITSANIACGIHAGDPVVMRKTVNMATRYDVQIGAHPGYPDLQGFGRRYLDLAVEELETWLLYQLGALQAFLREIRVEMVHVKPHGALYNKASVDSNTAGAIARIIKSYDPHLILVGQAGSKLVQAGKEVGLQVAEEAFPDRAYESDGSLRSRKLPSAVHHDPEIVARNALKLAMDGIQINVGDRQQSLSVQTICLHGDSPNAVDNARMVREILETNGIEVKKLAKL